MPRTLSLAAIQTSYGSDMDANIKKTEGFIRQAAAPVGQAGFRGVLGQTFTGRLGAFPRPLPRPDTPCLTGFLPACVSIDQFASRQHPP